MLTLSQHLLDEIIEHCRQSYPNEACGIVSGRHGQADTVYPMANVSSEPERFYLLDREEQLAVFRNIRDARQDLLAIYHSHPHSPAYPSATDVDLAFYPDAFYIIVSMAVDPPDVRAFRIDWKERTVRAAALRVCEGEQ